MRKFATFLKTYFLYGCRASHDIKAGEPITACRVPLDKCNYFRQKLLQADCIDCTCSRCKDSSEYGTGYGSVSCSQCPGFLSSSTGTTSWKCSSCKESKPEKECTKILEDLNSKLERAAKDDKLDTADYYEVGMCIVQ